MLYIMTLGKNNWWDLSHNQTLCQSFDWLHPSQDGMKQRGLFLEQLFEILTGHFHNAIAIGGQPIETYRRILDEFKGRLVNLQCIVRDLVMFVYDERSDVNAGYMTYMILPLGKRL